MTPLSVTGNRAWRLATGIALVILGILVLGFGVMNARFDVYAAFITGTNVVTGIAMVLFHRL
jgi:uncharacterized membrane protein HdeD (DUF308 family)